LWHVGTPLWELMVVVACRYTNKKLAIITSPAVTILGIGCAEAVV